MNPEIQTPPNNPEGVHVPPSLTQKTPPPLKPPVTNRPFPLVPIILGILILFLIGGSVYFLGFRNNNPSQIVNKTEETKKQIQLSPSPTSSQPNLRRRPPPSIDKAIAIAELEYLKGKGKTIVEFSAFANDVLRKAANGDFAACKRATEEIPRRFDHEEVLKSASGHPDRWLAELYTDLLVDQQVAIGACAEGRSVDFQSNSADALRLDATIKKRLDYVHQVAGQ